jgi:hypothetical protein
MTFFLDNNLSEQLAKGMKGFGEKVVHLKDLFPEDAEDTLWLTYVGKNRMCLITRDERIRWRPAELRAFREHEVGAFFLGGKNRTACQLVQQLVRCWPQMKQKAVKDRRPFACRVSATGTKFVSIPLM